MILNYSWAAWLAWALGAIFIVSGIVNLAGFKPMRDALTGWGFPSWFFIVNGLCDLAIGAMILWYPTRPFGLLFSLLSVQGAAAGLVTRRVDAIVTRHFGSPRQA